MSQSAENGLPAFRVAQRVPVVTYVERVLLETDDWLEAEAEAQAGRSRVVSPDQELPVVVGTHPTHNFSHGERCANDGCGSYNNGSCGSHAPCGHDFRAEGKSLHRLIEDWRATRVTSPGETP